MEARARTRTVLALTATAAWIILAGTELYTQTMGFVVSKSQLYLPFWFYL